jgi:HPt (histidine-containing phosphotransfer) domain-containing protein
MFLSEFVIYGLLIAALLAGVFLLWVRKNRQLLMPPQPPSVAAEPLVSARPLASAPVTTPPRRFKTAEIAEHLDMAVLGQLLLGVSLKNYCDLLRRVFEQQSGSLALLLAALEQRDTQALAAVAHAFKGETASLGLRSLAAQALVCERDGAGFTPEDCDAAAASLRTCWSTAMALCQRMGLIPA